ncbi:MAG: hypothetical protein ABIF11_05455 [Nitrospirota bacterium]|uniref:Uncharacterized protein n=1 Tax=viral metagenome TaxID=1070528 RepID=A0A6M3JZQ3_9ZZZZ
MPDKKEKFDIASSSHLLSLLNDKKIDKNTFIDIDETSNNELRVSKLEAVLKQK